MLKIKTLALGLVLFSAVVSAATPVVVYQTTDGVTSTPVNSAGPMWVTGTVSTTPASASTAGPTSITASQCATLTSMNSVATVGVLVTGTWTGTLSPTKSVDGTTFVSTKAQPQPVGSSASSTSITANGSYTVDSAGMASFKVCGNTVSSGTAVVSLRTNTSAEGSIDGLAILAGTAATPSLAAITVQPPSGTCQTAVVSGAAEAGHLLKTGSGILCALTAVVGATSGYLLVFDAVACPSNGAVTPIWFAPVYSNGTNGAAYVAWPSGAALPAATGIAACFSTTGPFTMTSSATASFQAMVK